MTESASAAAPPLTVRGLRVELSTGAAIVAGVDLDLVRGEILGLVGESGSGKTTTALALLGHATPGARVTGGIVSVAGHDILGVSESRRRQLRGTIVSYVPQDAGRALNPALRIGDAIADVARRHRNLGSDDVLRLLSTVELPSTRAFARRFPHQLSGGQQQRVTIAMALSADPPLIVLDEPTTGLDVITQAAVLREVRTLSDELGAAMVYVSHDLAVVSELADRVAVMYAGQLVEIGPTTEVLERPRHPYTRGLVQSIPDHRRPARLLPMPGTAVGVENRPSGCPFAPRCPQRTADCDAMVPELAAIGPDREVRCWHHTATPGLVLGEPRAVTTTAAEASPVLDVKSLRAVHQTRGDIVVAARDVSFSLLSGECLALVGESGSGKTTIARCIAGLHRPAAGTIELGGAVLRGRVRRRSVEQRRRIQYIFQNPFESLNPRRTIADQLARPGQLLRGLSARQAKAEVTDLLEQVRLPERTAQRYPHQLSGGERQRVAIARALAAQPDVLVCDEITSALDVSVQAAVLDVLATLQQELSLAILLITHDLGVVSVAADRVAVLQSGRLCETGPVGAVIDEPQADYTRRLIAAAPSLIRMREPRAATA